MRPRTAISTKPPAAVAKSPEAARTWKRVIALYNETEAVLITAFDANLLAKYCLAEDDLIELTALRADIKKQWEEHLAQLKKMRPKSDQLPAYYSALAQANALLKRYQGIDARLDSKRKMLLAMEQSLYLTPRSRAAVAMKEKLPPEPLDEMETLLNG